jgi:hypothetical protein
VRRNVDVPRTYLKLAAVVLVTGIAAAACGSVKLGAAAIVGSQRVSAASLNGEVANLNAGYQKYKNTVQISYPASQMPQQVLAWIVRFQVRDQLAARYGITVTQAQQQRALSAISAQIQQSGGGVTLAEAAVASGLPPDMVNELGQYQAIETVLLNRFDGGKLPAASSAQQDLVNRFNLSECRAAKSMGIQINPQYGVVDYSDFSVVSAPSGLSKAGSGTPSASASKPVLTPPC